MAQITDKSPKNVSSHIPSVMGLTAADIMETQFAWFKPSMSMDQAVRIMLKHNTTGGPVIAEGEAKPNSNPHHGAGTLVGFLSERDCLRQAVESRYLNSQIGIVEDYMRPRVFTLRADTQIMEIADLFIDQWFHIYPVIEVETVIGVVTRKNVLAAVHKLRHGFAST